MTNSKEITPEQLSLEETITKQINDGNYISAFFLIHSSTEYMLKQVLLSKSGKKTNEEIFTIINRLQLNHIALFLYLNETINLSFFKELQRLHSLRHNYAHECIQKYLFDNNENEKQKMKVCLKTQKQVFDLFMKTCT